MYNIFKPTLFCITIVLTAIILAYVILNPRNVIFKEEYHEAQQRVQHIQKEIMHAQDIIQQTKLQLDSIEEHVNELRDEQTRIIHTYNSRNPEITYRLALEREQLNQLKTEYNITQQEKRNLGIQLDSLSIYIQKNFLITYEISLFFYSKYTFLSYCICIRYYSYSIK